MSTGSASPARPPVGVLTVDDQPTFRLAARQVIEATPGFALLGEADSGEAALALARSLAPDLVLVDVRMPGLDGLETARRLKASHPATAIVLVTACPDSVPAGADSCGAEALVHKEELAPALLRRLWDAHGRPAPG